MIERMTGLPDPVLGFVASEVVTAKDYETGYIPAVESMTREYGKVRILYQIGPDFKGFSPGAA